MLSHNVIHHKGTGILIKSKVISVQLTDQNHTQNHYKEDNLFKRQDQINDKRQPNFKMDD